MDRYRAWSRRLLASYNAADGAYYRWAKRSHVTWHVLALLYALDDGLPHSQKQICQAWGFPKTTLNTAVKACRTAGYVTLEAMPDQPRQRQICLTEAGRACAEEALGELCAAEDRAMEETVARFGPAFVEAAEFFFSRFREAIDENLSEREEVSSP